MISNKIVKEDLDYIFNNLDSKEVFDGANVLITGCAGFLGFYFLQFLSHYSKELNIASIVGLDNYKIGKPQWLNDLQQQNKNISIKMFDISTDNIKTIPNAEKFDVIIHMASIASPMFYRQYPIETIDANIWGLRNLLDFYCDKDIKSFIYFSSSEIYGDPSADNIPTPETYNGNVSCIGPRACYDESKRFGETILYSFANKFDMPIKIIRPFNNYGPGMSIDDKRVPADFAKAVLHNQDIIMYSDGLPTRTYCYIADAVLGYLKVLGHGEFDYFNIGIDKPEISVARLAEIYKAKAVELLGYTGDIRYAVSDDVDYLTHNPNRRCPDITKARQTLGYNPSISVEEGVARYLEFLKQEECL